MMNIAVVILNWNGRSLLEQFLPSVILHSKEATVYVVDNASSDDSVAYLKENHPSVKIIQNNFNGGYAKGYNDGLKSLKEELFVLLNSDVEVTENWLRPISEAFESNSTLVAAQPKILDYKKKTHFEYAGAAGGFLDRFGYPFCRGRIFEELEEDTNQYEDSSIFWASGACFFVKNDAFWAAGAFDEDLFAHQEEIDLCWRLQSRNGIINYIGASTVYHVGGATLNAASPQKTFYNFRNSLLILLKNVKGGKLWLILFLRMLLDGVAGTRFLFSGKAGHFMAVLKAHLSFYALIPKFLRKRSAFASNYRYYKINSVVWKFFIAKKRNFNDL